MNRTSSSVLRAVSALLLGGGLALSDAMALSVTPGRQEIVLSPGAERKLFYDVTNETAKEMLVEVSDKDWFKLEANKDLDVSKWMKIKGKTEFSLKPGKSRKVEVVVTCPKNAQGELVGMVSFAYQGLEASMITSILSLAVYVTAAGTEKIEGHIKDITLLKTPEIFRILVNVESTGNVHLRPTGKAEIFDAAGQSVVEAQIPESNPAYPLSPRSYPADIKGLTLKPGAYHVKVIMNARGLELKGEKTFTVAADGAIKS